MLESSGVIFSYLSPTWTKSPSYSRSPSGTRSPSWTGIALRCDPGSPGLSRCHTLCRNFGLGRNPRAHGEDAHTFLQGARAHGEDY